MKNNNNKTNLIQNKISGKKILKKKFTSSFTNNLNSNIKNKKKEIDDSFLTKTIEKNLFISKKFKERSKLLHSKMMMDNKHLKQSIYNKIRKSKFLKNFDIISSDDDLDLFTPTIITNDIKNSKYKHYKDDYKENTKQFKKNKNYKIEKTNRSPKENEYYIQKEKDSNIYEMKINLDTKDSIKNKKNYRNNFKKEKYNEYKINLNNENYFKYENNKDNNLYDENSELRSNSIDSISNLSTELQIMKSKITLINKHGNSFKIINRLIKKFIFTYGIINVEKILLRDNVQIISILSKFSKKFNNINITSAKDFIRLNLNELKNKLD